MNTEHVPSEGVRPDETWATAACCECTRPVLMWPTGFKMLSPMISLVECPWCHMVLDVHWDAGKTTKRGI